MIDHHRGPESHVPRPTRGTGPARHDRSADAEAELPASVASALATYHPPAAPTPATIEGVMRAVRARPLPGRAVPAGAGVRSLVTRRLGGRWWYGAVAASLVGGTAIAASAWSRHVALDGAAPGVADRTVAVLPRRAAHFFVLAPGARHVVVVGDFNGWSRAATPMHRDAASGAWTASVVLPDGRYVYAYLVDGARWMPDPNAPLAPADGFGRQNSVLLWSAQYAVR